MTVAGATGHAVQAPRGRRFGPRGRLQRSRPDGVAQRCSLEDAARREADGSQGHLAVLAAAALGALLEPRWGFPDDTPHSPYPSLSLSPFKSHPVSPSR